MGDQCTSALILTVVLSTVMLLEVLRQAAEHAEVSGMLVITSTSVPSMMVGVSIIRVQRSRHPLYTFTR